MLTDCEYEEEPAVKKNVHRKHHEQIESGIFIKNDKWIAKARVAITKKYYAVSSIKLQNKMIEQGVKL